VGRHAGSVSISETGGILMAAPVVWFEIAGRDLDTLTRFYGDLLGWKVDADNPQR
jgi:predicted enzyme related to lactoylglutathione lyase